jgi:hypothetical protein
MRKVRRLSFFAFVGALAACSGSGSDVAETPDAEVDAAPPVAEGCVAKEPAALGTGYFVDVSEKAGIQVDNFDPMPPAPLASNDHSRLAFADIDGDGWDDVIATNLFPDPVKGTKPFEHLVFRNKHDGTFENVTDATGLRGIQAGVLAFADVDNDGDVDVFAGIDSPITGATNQIWLNDGSGKFAQKMNSGVEAGSDGKYTANALFADVDGDGKLDLFLGNGQTSAAVPDQLYLGNGDGSFREVTSTNLQGGNPAQPTNGVTACDFDDDGDLDILVSTYSISTRLGANILWRNDGTGKFTNGAQATGFAAQATGNYWVTETGKGTAMEPKGPPYTGSNGFGIDCQDVNGDGHMDVFASAISHPDTDRWWGDPTTLLINQGPDGGYAFVNEFLKRKLPNNEGDVDGAAVDFDNDGLVDLSLSRDNKYEGNYTTYDQKSWFGLMHQLDDGSFESVGQTCGINDGVMGGGIERMKAAQNHAWADIDHDGDLDLLVGGRAHGPGRPNYLFENQIGSKNNWLAVRLKGDGVKVNRDAIGARATLRGEGRVLMREVPSTRGTYDSGGTRTLHFGLAHAGCAYTLEVRWPNGTTESFDASQLGVNHFVTLEMGKGLSK